MIKHRMLLTALAMATLILAACGGVSKQEPASEHEPAPATAAPAGSQAVAASSDSGVSDAAAVPVSKEAPSLTAVPIALKTAPAPAAPADNGAAADTSPDAKPSGD
jgi:hypothetical protein